MSPITLTRLQSREIDRIAIEQYGMSGLVLMENAGRGVVDVLISTDPKLLTEPSASVVILCGKGNNAGDGFVIARHLEILGVSSKVVLLASCEQLRGDAANNFRVLQHCAVPMVDLSAEEDLSPALSREAAQATWLVDAMLGTGAIGEPRDPYSTAIKWMNSHPARALAVDVPSGLDCDTGKPSEATVRADLTCTFVACKHGFEQDAASAFLGDLHVVSIGVSPIMLQEVSKSK